MDKLRASLKEELLSEVGPREHIPSGGTGGAATLRPTAEEFVPRERVPLLETAEAGGVGRPVQQPTPFDGKTPWDAYRTQFELIAEMNH